jgi:uncharacterized protein YqeY
MSLLDKIKSDNLLARKRKEKFVSGILTTLIGEIEMIGKNNGNRKTTDAEAVKCITKFKKGTSDNIQLLMKNKSHKGIIDLENEYSLYEKYLPELLTEDELTKIINNLIEMLEKPNMGIIMKGLKESNLSYDGKTASKIANNLLKGNK